ncbi:hypothetical protein [Streptomyces erythrochromogenes]|uniref:hypothetical protein n=1 Tax=Streptomyces erythrochromogenes TaxID=285574 RepID=UPI0036CA7BB4
MIDTEVLCDAGMMYFDARRSATYPTVEVRGADVGLDASAPVLLAALPPSLRTGMLATVGSRARSRAGCQPEVGELTLSADRPNSACEREQGGPAGCHPGGS